MTVGKKIQEIRKKNKLTQSEFAKIVGISISGLTSIEGGVRNPRFTTLHKICNAFNLEFNIVFKKAVKNNLK